MKAILLWLGLSALCFASAAFAEEPYCREYTQSFTVGGKTQNGYGTACREPDGSWKIISQQSQPSTGAVDKAQVPIQYVVKQEKIYVTPTPVVIDHNLPWVDEPPFGPVVVIGGHGPRHHRHYIHEPYWR